MKLKELHAITNTKGEMICDGVDISIDEWHTLLSNPQAATFIEDLLCFAREPKHMASCKTISNLYGREPQHYNAKVISFSKWVQKTLNRYRIIRPNGTECFWPICMSKGYEEKNGFVWQLRDELVEGLQILLIERLINKFKTQHERLPFNGYDELYKWELINKDDQVSTIDIIKSLKGINIISNMHVDGIFKNLIKENPERLEICVDKLFDESKGLEERLKNFKTDMKELGHPGNQIFANDERTAAGLLTCKYPQKYTAYMDSLYQMICQYFGIESKKVGQKYIHYMNIINIISDKYGDDIQNIIKNEVSQFKITPKILATQTLFWCMRDEMTTSIEKKKTLTWIPFYMELADALLLYKDNRKSLIDIIYGLDHKIVKYIKTKDEKNVYDVDPFTVFAIFNRGLPNSHKP